MAGKRILGTFHSLAFYYFSYKSLSNDAGVLVGCRRRRLSC
jgi:hypothetical protein